MAEWETREQLLDAAANAGYLLSPAQLGRLHRAGLVPSPEVKALGRGRGTESRFPPGTADRLIRAAKVHAETHRFSDVGWRLWWEEGGDIPPPALEALRRVAASADSQREALAALLEGNEVGTPQGVAGVDKLYRDAERSPLPRPLAEIRRNVGRKRFGSVVHGLVAAVAGRPQDTAYSDQELDDLTRRAFGFGPVQPDDQEMPAEEQSLDLETFTELSAKHTMTELANADGAELDLARVQAQSLIVMVMATASLFDRLGGPGWPNLGAASRMLASERPGDQMMFLLAVLALRTSEAFRCRLEKVGAVSAPQADTANQMYGMLRAMREEIPVLEELMADDRLGVAIQDGDAVAQLSAEIRRLRDEDSEQFDAFFAAHPEADELATAFEVTTEAAGS